MLFNEWALPSPWTSLPPLIEGVEMSNIAPGSSKQYNCGKPEHLPEYVFHNIQCANYQIIGRRDVNFVRSPIQILLSMPRFAERNAVTVSNLLPFNIHYQNDGPARIFSDWAMYIVGSKSGSPSKNWGVSFSQSWSSSPDSCVHAMPAAATDPVIKYFFLKKVLLNTFPAIV